MSLFHAALQPALDSNGNPISGAVWSFHRSGTVTAASVYSNAALTTALGSFVTADASGRFVPIFFPDHTAYRAILKDAGGSTIKDIDPIGGASIGMRSVKAYGAIGNGTTDDREAVQAAIDAASSDGGGGVFIPFGTYRLTKASGAYCLTLPSNVYLVGEGPGSVLKRANGTDGAHVINIPDRENVGLLNLTIDGNRDNNSSTGHGIRVDGTDNLLIQNVLVRQCYSYGIGMQDGALVRIKLDNVCIEDTGADGLDTKNIGVITLAYDGGTVAFAVGDTVTGATSGTSAVVTAVSGSTASGTLTLDQDTDTFTNDGTTYQDFTDNEELRVGGVTRALVNGTLSRTQNEDLQISNLSVRRWGLDTSRSTQAAVDLRGTWTINGLFISEPRARDSVGLRFRQGETLGVNGLGAHESIAHGLDIRMDTDATIDGLANTQKGLYSAARNVRASGGTISGGSNGVQIIESSNEVDLRVNDSVNDGILIAQNASDPGLTPHKTILESCRVTNCGGDGIQVEANDCDVIACQSESNTGYGLNITATANRTKVSGGLYGSNNTAGRLNNSGASTTITPGIEGVTPRVDGNALSGTYTPTLTGTANVAASTAYACQWMRVGNIVTVSGKVDITPTANATSTAATLTLPVASNFANDGELAGVSKQNGTDGTTGRVNAATASDLAVLNFTSDGTALRSHWFTFTYQVI